MVSDRHIKRFVFEGALNSTTKAQEAELFHALITMDESLLEDIVGIGRDGFDLVVLIPRDDVPAPAEMHDVLHHWLAGYFAGKGW